MSGKTKKKDDLSQTQVIKLVSDRMTAISQKIAVVDEKVDAISHAVPSMEPPCPLHIKVRSSSMFSCRCIGVCKCSPFKKMLITTVTWLKIVFFLAILFATIKTYMP